MTPLFLPQLVNDPFGDPAVYMQIRHEKKAVLFDLGDLSRLPARKLMKISHIFVSHCHMDHFIGFDQLLRCVLGRPNNINIFGPPGFLVHVRAKLAGYTWNLVKNSPLSLTISEIHTGQYLLSQTLFCRDGFRERALTKTPLHDHTILSTPGFSVQAVILDHKIACAAYSLQEPSHINFRQEVLEERQWPRGPWLSKLRMAIRNRVPGHTCFEVGGKTYTLHELASLLTITTPGQKITYVTDINASRENLALVKTLTMNSDILFCEASFLVEDQLKAAQTHHLTATQAGRLAEESHVKKLIIFHFSPKHHGDAQRYYQEAATTFSGRIA